MRKFLMIALLAAAPVGAREAPKPTLDKADCRAPSAQQAQDARRIGPQRLGELPDAELIRAVDYREGGCSTPIRINRTVRR